MRKEYVLKCLTRKGSVVGYLEFDNIYIVVERESDATKFKDFDTALYEKNRAYRSGFNFRLVIEEVKEKTEGVKIHDYTLHGDYYLSDNIIPNKNWGKALHLKTPITLPNGKKVIARTLSREELEVIPKEERGIDNKWYWTSSPIGFYNAWAVDHNGDLHSIDFDVSNNCGGARLGFKNPFLKEKKYSEDEINSAVNEVMDLFDYERVYKVMSFMDWEWVGKNIPEIYDLRVESRRLLEEAANKVIKGEEYYFVATGGFKAEAWKNDDNTLGLRLNFILEECEN